MRVAIKKTDHATRGPWTPGKYDVVCSAHNDISNPIEDIGFSECRDYYVTVGKQTHDLTVIASDSKTTQSGGDNRKKFPLGAALQVPQNFSFAPL